MAGDTEGGLQGGRITPLFDGGDRLAGNSDNLAEFRLGHRVMLFAKLAHSIVNRNLLRHNLHRRAVIINLKNIFGDLADHQAGENRIKEQITVVKK